MRIATIIVFLIESILSHMPGDESGRESQALAKLTGINESLLRSAAHIILFVVLSILAIQGYGWSSLIIVSIWCLVDEFTKQWIPGRHFSWVDVGLNVIGTALGAGIACWVSTMVLKAIV